MNLSIVRLIWDMVKRDFRNRFAGSVFGLSWNFLLPLSYIIIYTTVFSQIMIAKLPGMESTFDYSVYLSSGILAWTVFSNTILKYQTIFIENSNLVKKVYFPKSILLFSTFVSSIIEMLINYTILFLILIIIGYDVHINYLLIIFIIIFQQIFGLGIGLFLSVLNVHFRDLHQFVSLALPIWFWLTPIVYIKEILSNNLQTIMYYNPLYYFTEAYQSLITLGKIENFIYMIAISLFTCLVGGLFYRKMVSEVSDLI